MTITITLPRAVIEQAIESMQGYARETGDTQPCDAEKALSAALAQQAEQATCEWKQDPDYEMGDTYHSSCGELWSFIDGGPKENRVSYCHHCGKPVKLAAPKGGV